MAAALVLAAGCGSESAEKSGASSKGQGRGASRSNRDSANKITWLFALTADTGSLADSGGGMYKLSLQGVDDRMIAFADRPQREVQILPTAKFHASWTRIFEDDPPNAVLVQHAPGAPQRQTSLVLELDNPVHSTAKGTITYRARILAEEDHPKRLHGVSTAALHDGAPPQNFEDASLFIDAYPTAVNDQITDS